MCNNIKFYIYIKQVTKLFSGKEKKLLGQPRIYLLQLLSDHWIVEHTNTCEKWNKCLLCESTLRKWAESFDTRSGLLKDVLKIMHPKEERLIAADKIAVLCFDELYVSN